MSAVVRSLLEQFTIDCGLHACTGRQYWLRVVTSDLLDYLQADGALAGEDVRVIVAVDVELALVARQAHRDAL